MQSTNVVNLRPSCSLPLAYVLGILNSGLVNVYFRLRFPGNNHIPANQLARIPVPNASGEQQEKLVGLVERMLELHQRKGTVRTSDAKTRVRREIDATDRQIDGLAYELYGLTDEDIALVEAAAEPAATSEPSDDLGTE